MKLGPVWGYSGSLEKGCLNNMEAQLDVQIGMTERYYMW